VSSVRTQAHRRKLQRAHHAAAARTRFYSRGERAWQQYRRDGIARPVDEVFDRIDARVERRRREITWSVGAELAKRATRVTFPPPPEPQDW
jgi:hypothetical protein